jgi:hypothetical protein
MLDPPHQLVRNWAESVPLAFPDEGLERGGLGV